MANAVKLKIAFEISQIDELIEKSSVLLQKCILQEPDFIELNAAGAILHSYYNGLENIFLLIRKNIDKTVLSSERWHSELLKSMFAATEARRPLFEKKLYDQLVDYMGFRHFFRHTYGYQGLRMRIYIPQKITITVKNRLHSRQQPCRSPRQTVIGIGLRELFYQKVRLPSV
ncbi:ribonuclease toxin HepT-like protein [Treponema socranskii]